MPYKDVTPPRPHLCDALPNDQMLDTVLECIMCGAQYQLTRHDDQREGSWVAWKKVRNATKDC